MVSKAVEWIGLTFLGLTGLALSLHSILLHFNLTNGFINSLYTGAFIFLAVAIFIFTIKIWQHLNYLFDLIAFIGILIASYLIFFYLGV